MSIVNNASYYTTDQLVEILKQDNIQIDNKVIERARSDDDKAFCLIGEKYYHSKDYLKAIIWLLKSAYFNNSGAQYYIGRIFETGINSTNNKQQALEWYQRSADQTNRLAITRMIKLKWKGHFLDSNQKAFINLERKTDELKCNYLAKVQDLEQRYQANLKVLDYEKLSFEYDKIRSSNLKPIRESDEIIYSQLELLEKNVGRKLEVLEMKNQLLEDSIKILERENLLNQEAFEKEKKKIGESFDIVQMENKRLHQQLKEEEEKSSDRIATLMEENQSNIAEIQTKSQDIQDKLAQVESTLLENRKFDERLAALENIFSNLVSSEFTTGYEDLPQADNHSNKEDANKIRIVFEYNERMNK